MEQLAVHVNEGITELFKVAEANIKLAKKIYSLSKSEFYYFGAISPYLKSGNTEVMSFAAMIAMDNFHLDLSIEDLITIQRSSDSLLRARARVIAIQRKPKPSDYDFLLHTQKPPFCTEEAHLARELLLIGFGEKLSSDLLIDFQRTANEEIRSASKNYLFNRNPGSFSPSRLETYSKDTNTNVSATAAELLLKHFSKSLTFTKLIDFQLSDNANVRDLARKKVLELRKDDLVFEKLNEYRRSKNKNLKNIATELIIKNFDYNLSAREIFDLQKSESATIRGTGRDLALSQPLSRWINGAIKKAKGSHDFNVRKLAVELDEKFESSDEIRKEALEFLSKYGF